MTGSIDFAKRALLHGRLHRRAVRTPPWALEIDAFAERCTRCGDCTSVCPEKIIVRGDGGFPSVDFDSGGCTFCRACVDACPVGALSPAVDPPWRQQARATDTCLASRGIYCQSCRDSCGVAAIAFLPAANAGAVPHPRIDSGRCTGCGECVATCPVGAIAVVPMERIA